MTRKRLSLIVGIVGFLCAGASLLGILVMGSIFADARTENIAGPGVDVFMRTPFPTPNSTVTLEIEARGGSRAGVQRIAITSNGAMIHETKGTGEYLVHRGKQRGSDSELVSFPLQMIPAGSTLPLQIDVDYVVGSRGSYTNAHHHGRVFLDVTVYSNSGRVFAQIARVALALGCFLFWFMLVWGIAKLYAKVSGAEPGRDAAEAEGIGLLMGYMGGSILGYWLFAWRIMNALELSSTLWAVLLMAVWCVVPLLFTWRWWKRHKNRADLPAARVVAR